MALGEARTHGRVFLALNIILAAGCLLQSYVGGTAEILESNMSEIGIILFCAGALVGPMIVSGVFREMHSQQHSDVVYALPMSAGERYASKILAFVYLHVLPVMIWGGIAVLATVLRVNSLGEHVIGLSAERCVLYYGFLNLGTLFIDAIAVVCSVCCGRLAETQYLTYLTAASISMGPLLLRTQLMEKIGGQTTDPGLGYFLWTLSPLAWKSNAGMTTYGIVCLTNCLISAAVITLAFFVYRNRDAGSAGKPIVSRVFFEIALAVGLVSYYALLLFSTSLAAVIALGGVVYLVIHIISFRGILSVGKVVLWFGKFALTTAAFLLLLWIAYASDGFGAIRYIPSQDMGGACIRIEREWGYGDVAPMKLVAYAGLPKYTYDLVGAAGITTYDEISGKEINDAKIREVVDVFQKYAADRDKDFVSFWEFFAQGIERKNGTERDRYCEVIIWFPNKDGKVIMRQGVKLTVHQASELMNDLSMLGYMNFNSTSN
ncbi:MAG: hypothetical protein IKI15_01780 [Lachnospiraceae bacterium]|nr:hypothetical protein [Lachnospiraceae bacterium]